MFGVDGLDGFHRVGSGLSLLLHEFVVDGLRRFAELGALLGREDYYGRAALLDLLAEDGVVLLTSARSQLTASAAASWIIFFWLSSSLFHVMVDMMSGQAS